MADELRSERQIEQLRILKGGLVPKSCAHRCAAAKIAKFGLINRHRPLRALPLRRLIETKRTRCAQCELFRVRASADMGNISIRKEEPN